MRVSNNEGASDQCRANTQRGSYDNHSALIIHCTCIYILRENRVVNGYSYTILGSGNM